MNTVLPGSFSGQVLMLQELLQVPWAKWALQSNTLSLSGSIIQQPLSDSPWLNTANALCLFYTEKK